MNFRIKVKRNYLVLLTVLILALISACRSPTPTLNLPAESLGPPDRVDVVYFTQGEPCHCIAAVGEHIQTVIWINFQDQLGSGKLTFKVVNLDDPKNAALAAKYNAMPFSLFINEVRGNEERIIPVPEIWLAEYRYDEEAFEELIKTKIEKSLSSR